LRLDLAMRDQDATDHRIARLAERQGGIVAHAQLRAIGVSAAAIHRRVQAGRLHPRYRGVYAVGHRGVGPEGLLWAAVLASGRGAIVSHVSAGSAWDMLRSSSRTVDGAPVPPPSKRSCRATAALESS